MGDTSPEMQIGLDKVSAHRKLVVSDTGRSQHIYIVGKTGTGKSTLLRNLIAADIAAGHGVGLLDPHGTEAAILLDAIPAHRIRETIYYDPADTDHPIPFNVLADVPPERRHLVADAVVGNVGSVVSFRIGSSDAEILSRELDSKYPPQRFTGQSNFHIIATLASSDGASVLHRGQKPPPRCPLRTRRVTTIASAWDTPPMVS